MKSSDITDKQLSDAIHSVLDDRKELTAYQAMSKSSDEYFVLKIYPKSGNGDKSVCLFRQISPHTWKLIKRTLVE